MTPEEWESAFEAFADPLAVLTTEGVSLFVNRELRTLLGRRPDQGRGVHFSALLRSREQPDPVRLSLADGKARSAVLRLETVPGTWQVTASPRRGAEGDLRGLLVVLKEVTALREQQERLVQAARLSEIGQLAGGIAHEINTPLASIALRAQSLLKKAESPELRAVSAFERFPRYLDTIDREAFRCKRIIAALLDFAGARRPERRPTDLNALAGTAGDLLGHAFRRKEVRLDMSLDPGLPRVTADGGQLRQVLLALLLNALDASPQGGAIAIETRGDEDGWVRLSVADDGPGIPEELCERVFNPFFTTKPTGSGTGLGLAVCHGIVSSHGGTIDVGGTPGSGTRVEIRLPVSPAAEDADRRAVR